MEHCFLFQGESIKMEEGDTWRKMGEGIEGSKGIDYWGGVPVNL